MHENISRRGKMSCVQACVNSLGSSRADKAPRAAGQQRREKAQHLYKDVNTRVGEVLHAYVRVKYTYDTISAYFLCHFSRITHPWSKAAKSEARHGQDQQLLHLSW